MRFLALLCTVTFVLASFAVQAQEELSKDEEKRWKQMAKDYKKDPAALKKLTEDKVAYQQEALQAKSEIARLQNQLSQQTDQLTMLQQQNNQLTTQLNDANQIISDLNNQVDQLQNMPPPEPADRPQPNQPVEENFNQGVVFRVQVGAYRRVPAKYDGMPDLTVEAAGNLQKVLLGNYRNYDDAVARMRSLKSQGYKNPWVVGFRDGVRVSLREARGY